LEPVFTLSLFMIKVVQPQLER